MAENQRVIKTVSEALIEFLVPDLEDMATMALKKEVVDTVNMEGGLLRITIEIGTVSPQERIRFHRSSHIPPGQLNHVARTLAGEIVKINLFHEYAGMKEDDIPPILSIHDAIRDRSCSRDNPDHDS